MGLAPALKVAYVPSGATRTHCDANGIGVLGAGQVLLRQLRLQSWLKSDSFGLIKG
jgi:hypothetical protein